VVSRSGGASAKVNFQPIDPGSYTVKALAYTSTDGTGQIIARAEATAKVLAGQTTVVTLVADALAVRVSVDPQQISLMLTDNPYVHTWLLNGPHGVGSVFSTLLDTDFLGGESTVIPLAGTVSGGQTWFSDHTPNSVMELTTAFGGLTQCAAYAAVYVYSPTAQTANFWMGSDDGIKAWLNGQVIWTNNVDRAYGTDQDRTTASLRQGWNLLLVKISQNNGAWRFSVRICDASGNLLPGIEYSTSQASNLSKQIQAAPRDADGNAILGNLQWVSSNPSVAGVDDSGMVTAQSAGDCTITVTDTVSGLSGTAQVHVGTEAAP
jgi:hypothetical protein